MKRADILRRLEERLARGEISEKTYLEIKARYEAEPTEQETEDVSAGEQPPGGTAGRPDDVGVLIERAIRESLEPALRNLPQIRLRLKESLDPALRGMEFADFGKGVMSTNGVVRIAGSGVVTGNPVRTREFKSAGSGRVVGDLDAAFVKVAGSCVFEGNAHAREFHSAGSVKVNGRLEAQEIHGSGAVNIGGDMEGRECHFRGNLHVGGRTTAQEFHLAGAGTMGGPLEAREVHIELGDEVRVAAIIGTEIDVRRPAGFFRGRSTLQTEEVDGREVYLECTVAGRVTGEEVTIGPHCRIGVVEARELTVHDSSEVRERRPFTGHRSHAGHAGHAGAPPPPPPGAPPIPPVPPVPPTPPPTSPPPETPSGD